MVRHSKKAYTHAAKELAGLFATHFSKLPPKERKKREQDFRVFVANIGNNVPAPQDV
jgi:hypothetical protein